MWLWPHRRAAAQHELDGSQHCSNNARPRLLLFACRAGLVSFSAVCYFLVRCDLGDPELKAAYAQQVGMGKRLCCSRSWDVFVLAVSGSMWRVLPATGPPCRLQLGRRRFCNSAVPQLSVAAV